MSSKSIFDFAESYGLTIETVSIPDHDDAYRVYKGVNPVFIGTNEAVQEFLETYKKELPGPLEIKLRGYKE